MLYENMKKKKKLSYKSNSKKKKKMKSIKLIRRILMGLQKRTRGDKTTKDTSTYYEWTNGHTQDVIALKIYTKATYQSATPTRSWARVALPKSRLKILV